MPKETQIKFKDFLKVVKTCANKKFAKFNIIQKRGSAIRFELFNNKNDEVPSKMWVVHESKYVYTDDLKKACDNLEVTKEEFEKKLDEI